MGVRWPPVLMYHAVNRMPEDPNRVCVTPERFGRQMEYLNRRGLKGVSMRELVRATRAGEAKGLVGLTFDDGYKDFLHAALPILEQHRFSATVFVLGDLLGQENVWDKGPRIGLLDIAGVREVRGRGMEVGSHGSSHTRLSGLDPERLREEVSHSRSYLGEVLGEEVEGFCYPYGDLDGAAVGAVRRAGYSYACAYKKQVFRGFHDIPRVHADERDGDLRLGLKLKNVTRYVDFLRSLR